jgi:phenylacetate-CoA ligase
MIKQIIGRTSEFFTLPSGRKFNPWLFKALISRDSKKNIFLISQYQVIQESRNKILVKIVKGREFDPNIILKIKRGFKKLFYDLNENVEVEIIVVDSIPKERSGKRLEIISMKTEKNEFHKIH